MVDYNRIWGQPNLTPFNTLQLKIQTSSSRGILSKKSTYTAEILQPNRRGGRTGRQNKAKNATPTSKKNCLHITNTNGILRNHICPNVAESDTIGLDVSQCHLKIFTWSNFVLKCPNNWSDNKTLSYRETGRVKFARSFPTNVGTEADFKCWNLSGVILSKHRRPSVMG